MEISSNKNISSSLVCPGSKSYANRMLFLAALSDKETKIKNLPLAEDVQYFLNALLSLGFDIKKESDLTIIGPLENYKTKNSSISLGEGGTTIRFMLILLASIGGSYKLSVNKRFLKRPLDDITKIFHQHGVDLTVKNDHILINGKISLDAEILVDCEKTTQFASGFIMLHKLGRISSVKTINVGSSQKYLDLTSSLHVQESYQVPADFSSLSYLVAWGVIEKDLLIKNVYEIDHLQADSILFKYLKSLGAKFGFTENGLSINKSNLSGKLMVDASLSLDLIPTLIFLSACFNIELEIKNYNNLVYKESDRLSEIIKCLDRFKIKYSLSEELLKIEGPMQSNEKIDVHCSYDHRIVMMNYLILKKLGKGTIEPIQAINKSFPEFLKIFN